MRLIGLALCLRTKVWSEGNLTGLGAWLTCPLCKSSGALRGVHTLTSKETPLFEETATPLGASTISEDFARMNDVERITNGEPWPRGQ